MKLSKDEIISKISEKIDNEDLKMELLEDIADSIDNNAEMEMQKALDEANKKYDDLKEKYIERFNTKDERKNDDEEVIEKNEVKDVIDIREI